MLEGARRCPHQYHHAQQQHQRIRPLELNCSKNSVREQQRRIQQQPNGGTAPIDAVKLLDVGQMIHNRWSVETHLDSGGFGQVYAVFDNQLKRRVAVKAEPSTPRFFLFRYYHICKIY